MFNQSKKNSPFLHAHDYTQYFCGEVKTSVIIMVILSRHVKRNSEHDYYVDDSIILLQLGKFYWKPCST